MIKLDDGIQVKFGLHAFGNILPDKIRVFGKEGGLKYIDFTYEEFNQHPQRDLLNFYRSEYIATGMYNRIFLELQKINKK